eukprot:TRINITY_DN1938_c0_g2_i3.p2 TRINITY_DN1938_c0_g2~~TRINITY_DN1938_c0_g2_i3.p2  ORF type:complete len:128 (+),score=28.03 TRINITY_DN1938_c0_g2_i3:59-442(+)
MEMIKRGLRWVRAGTGREPKHHGWLHPLVVGIITIIITLTIFRCISLYLTRKYNMVWEISDFARYTSGIFLFLYYLFLIFGRMTFMGFIALYDMLWTCNITMLVASVGFLLKDPIICLLYTSPSPRD